MHRRSSLSRSFPTAISLRSYSSVPFRLGQANFQTTFGHLQENEISKKEGEFVQLPVLYDERQLAKDLREEDCKSFLLTKERLLLWEEMNKASGSYSERQRLDGTCLSGPNGVGKSSVLHMLASVAHVNKWIVLYIPKSGEWTRKLTVDERPNPTPASTYLLERFVELNEVHAEALDKMKAGLWNRVIAATGGQVNPFDVEDELLTTLNKQKDFSVLYAFDEHQFLFPKDGENPARAPVNMLPDYFRRFRSWQTGTSGLRTFTIYSGSAHSKFEQEGIASGEEHRLRYIRPWKKQDFEKATRTKESSLYVPNIQAYPKLELYMREVTGHVPRMIRAVKEEFVKQEQQHPYATPEKKILASIGAAEKVVMTKGKDQVKSTFNHRSDKEKAKMIDYLGQILLPAWYRGLPKERDGQLYDRGFIYQDEEEVLRVVHGPARRALLDLFVEQSDTDNVVNLGREEAGYLFQRAVVKATLTRRAEEVLGRYYRQVAAPSPAVLNLYATDAIQLKADFSLPQVSLLSSLEVKGGNVIIVPEDKQFKAWDFIHYSVAVAENKVLKRTVTFIQTTVSEGKPTASGYWTADSNHPPKMKESMAKDDIVGKVLAALGFEFERICYDETKEEFIVETKKSEDIVRFVLVTASQLPSRTREKDHANTKFDMKNLIVVHRDELEKLGIVFAN